MLARLVPLLTVKYEATSIYLAKPSAKTGSSGKPLSCLFLGQPLLASLWYTMVGYGSVDCILARSKDFLESPEMLAVHISLLQIFTLHEP